MWTERLPFMGLPVFGSAASSVQLLGYMVYPLNALSRLLEAPEPPESIYLEHLVEYLHALPATEGSEIAMPSWPMIEYRAETWCLLVTHSSSHVRLALLRIPSPTFWALYHYHHQEHSIAIESIAYILDIITLQKSLPDNHSAVSYTCIAALPSFIGCKMGFGCIMCHEHATSSDMIGCK
jgi:hypothetical protein